MKIAVVTPELPNREYPNRGRSVYQTLLRLCEYADLMALCPLPRYPAHLRPRFDYRASDLSYSLPGLPTQYFEYPVFPVVTRPVNGFTCAHYLEPYVGPFHADVILNFWVYPAGYAALKVGRKLGIPVVVGSIGSDLNAIPDALSRWFTRKTLIGAQRVIAKSEQLRRRVMELGGSPEKTHVVGNGCDEAVFQPRDRNAARSELGVASNAELVAFVGRMNRVKGVAELLEAVSSLTRKRKKIQLVYIGDGPEFVAIREKVLNSHLAEHVRLPGACSPADVAKWLAAANVLALPSYMEGCPNAVLEALSCGRPVVASNVGAVPDLIDNSCGVLFPAGSVDGLSAALDEALKAEWDENAIAKRFRRSWQQVAQEIFAICEASLEDMLMRRRN